MASEQFVLWRSHWLSRIRLFWSLGTVTIDSKYYKEQN